jgi:hypothetical protein
VAKLDGIIKPSLALLKSKLEIANYSNEGLQVVLRRSKGAYALLGKADVDSLDDLLNPAKVGMETKDRVSELDPFLHHD